MLAILAPGQGAQKQGFLTPWFSFTGVAADLARHSASAGIDLVAAGTTMSDTDIMDTSVAQPLIVAASLATAALLPPLPDRTVFAGHSVGEYAAAALAGAVTDDTALRLVAARGAAMAAASGSPASGMVAVLGGDVDDVLAAITESGCSIADRNATGQVVAAGPRDALDRLTTRPPARARLRPLAVAGAFHTDLMASARQAVADAVTKVAVSDPRFGLLSNSDGTLLSDGSETMRRLVSQVCAPVRWDLCMQTLATMGVTATIELAPAGTLTALIRRELPDVATVALRSPDDLAAAQELISDHAAELTDIELPWQLLVSPARGTVRRDDARPDGALAAGEVVVRIATRTEDLAVRAAQPGHLVEWMVRDGDPVGAGQPLARVSPQVLT